MKKALDDTRVRESALRRNPFYLNLSSMGFAVFVMFLIGLAALIGTLFPQGMDEAFYHSRFGERLFHIYDSLGLLGVLRSWWFLLLFVLVLVGLVFCSHARITDAGFRGTKGTNIYVTEFSVPTPSADVILVFPVLLSSMGFRRRRLLQGDNLFEIVAERGVSPWMSSVLLHASATVLLVGLLLSYLFSWACPVHLEVGRVSILPSESVETRWSAFAESVLHRTTTGTESKLPRLELVELTKSYSPSPEALAVDNEPSFLPPRSLCLEDIMREKNGETMLLRGWRSSIRIGKGSRVRIVEVPAGESREALGIRISQGHFYRLASIECISTGETLQVVLPAAVAIGGTRFNVAPSPLLLRRAGAASDDSDLTDAGVVRFTPLSAPEAGESVTGSSVQGPSRRSLDARPGEEVRLADLSLRVLQLRELSVVRARFNAGRTLMRVGAVFLVFFIFVRLYMYSYVLRVKISGTRTGSSRLEIRIRASGLFASPPTVAQQIARLLAK